MGTREGRRELRTQLRGKRAKSRTRELRPAALGGDEEQTPGEPRGRQRVQEEQKVSPVHNRRLAAATTDRR